MTPYAGLAALSLLTLLLGIALPLVRSRIRWQTDALVRPRDPIQRFLHGWFAGALGGFALWTVALAIVGPGPLGVHAVPGPIAALGLLCGAAGLALVIVAQAQMGRSWRIGIDDGTTGLVTGGVFRRSRNPIYLGMLLLVLGVLIAAPSATAAFGLLITYILVGFQARSEEAHLAEIHGEAFERWAAEVGRFLPAIGRLRRRDRSA